MLPHIIGDNKARAVASTYIYRAPFKGETDEDFYFIGEIIDHFGVTFRDYFKGHDEFYAL